MQPWHWRFVIRTSMMVVIPSWSCNNGPIGEYVIRPKLIGIYCQRPFGCGPSDDEC
jgi:hypothetical protein